ncbi:MAG TPA: DUF2391 family protein [Candidatus Binatia bacterium]|nr:DUF2391 family protein [Candidatus Binatia bacterium]
MKKTATLKHIDSDLDSIRNTLERVPDHFNMRHVVGSLFGALLFGLPFVPKGLFIDVTAKLTPNHALAMLISIAVILTMEIYYIGYARVHDKDKRHFGQFWGKRIVAYVAVGFFVSVFLIYLYGLNYLVASQIHLRYLMLALALPCCIGASVTDLLKKY